MKFSELKRIFNTIIDVTGDDPILDAEQYAKLTADHQYLYAFDDYYIGVKISYQIKDNVVEPLYMVNPVVLISGRPYAVLVPSEEVVRMSDTLFQRWKNGDEDFADVFPSENLHYRFKELP